MGCYNTTGFVSGLSIRCSDPIVAIPCVVNNFGEYCPTNYYTTTQLVPISLPLFGLYDDYGCIDNIEDTPSSRAWKMCVSDDIKGCMKIFERANDDDTTLEEIYKRNGDYIKNFDNVKKGLENILPSSARVCLILEHRKVYEELTKGCQKGAREYINDMMSFGKLKFDKGINSKLSFGCNPFFTEMVGTKTGYRTDKELLSESQRLEEKYDNGEMWERRVFFQWKYMGFSAYRKTLSKKDSLFCIEGIADAFSDFYAFDSNIMKLNIGYRVPSCNCGSQQDNNQNVVDFYGFLIDFYEDNLKDDDDDNEWDEDE